MRVETIDLQGILRFTGRVTLDLRDVDGLVAVTGRNGDGKTTLLESFPATLFRQLPSRADGELYDYAHDRDSYLEQTFALGERRFRARLALDAIGRKSEAVLLEILPDGAERALNDGKVSTYDVAVREHLPTPALFLASAFGAQNRRGSFVTLDRRGRRQLFAELIGLAHYEAMAQTARTAAGVIDAARGRLLAVRDVLLRDTADHIDADLRQRTTIETDRLDAFERDRATQQARLDDLATELRRAAAEAEHYAWAVDQQRSALTDVQDQEHALVAVEAEQVQATTAHTRDRAAITAERDRVDADGTRTLAELAAELTAAERGTQTRVANNEALLARAADIRAAVAAVAQLESAIEAGEAEAARERDDQRGWDRQCQALQAELVTLERRVEDLARARRDAALIADVPCKGQGVYAACPLLTVARAAGQRIPSIAAEVAGIDDLRGRVDAAAAQIAASRIRETALVEWLRAWQAELRDQRATAADQARLEAAEDRIAELLRDLVQTRATVDRRRTEATDRAETRRVWRPWARRTTRLRRTERCGCRRCGRRCQPCTAPWTPRRRRCNRWRTQRRARRS